MGVHVDLHLGDCLEVMATMEPDSVDAIVTDPPYGLEFMGKGWDHGVPGVPFWTAALRVAKPGAHLLAFGGTRTYHRLACAIEDAGWEIRDTVMWVYGSGFPKSLNIGKSPLFCQCSSSNAQPSCNGDCKDRGQRQDRHTNSNPGALGEDDCCGFPEHELPESQQVLGSLGGCQENHHSCDEQPRFALDNDQGAGPLQADARTCTHLHGPSLQTLAGTGQKPGRPEHSGHPSTPDCASLNSECVYSSVTSTDNYTMGLPLCQVCGKPMMDGWGTALKPAWEPIIVARKPLAGTVAQNVLAWGTGAINIDACRVEGAAGSGVWGSSNKTCQDGRTFNASPNGEEYRSEQHPQGRWPANLIHDGSDEVMAGFPDGGAHGGNGNFKQRAWMLNDTPQDIERSTGSAARFFYCCKASRKDRDEGLEGMEAAIVKIGAEGHKINPMTGREVVDDPPRRNHHPTVKPTDLMRYLCRLVTPPGGVVLDPFMGSGSTGKAARLEGFRFVGIEQDAEYLEIAKRRIEAVQVQERMAI